MKNHLLAASLVLLLSFTSFAQSQELERGEVTAELNGTTIFYEVRGRGPVCMVMPNGWGVSHDALQFLFKDLEEFLTLVYFDTRGMGRSGEAETDEELTRAAVEADFDALRLHLGLERVIVMGWSHGGTEALEYAVSHPEAVAKLIVLHSGAHLSRESYRDFFENHPEVGQAIMEMHSADEPEEQMNRRMREMILDVWFPLIMADPEAGKPLIENMFAGAELRWRHMAYMQRNEVPYDVREALAGLEAPILLISGSKDAVRPEYLFETFAAAPDARHEIFEHSGHFAPLEEPERFISVIRQFVQSR